MGGPLAAISSFRRRGFPWTRSRGAGNLTLDHAKEQAGAQLVKDVAGSIPGLGGYV
jgi:hypothetical protein